MIKQQTGRTSFGTCKDNPSFFSISIYGGKSLVSWGVLEPLLIPHTYVSSGFKSNSLKHLNYLYDWLFPNLYPSSPHHMLLCSNLEVNMTPFLTVLLHDSSSMVKNSRIVQILPPPFNQSPEQAAALSHPRLFRRYFIQWLVWRSIIQWFLAENLPLSLSVRLPYRRVFTVILISYLKLPALLPSN